MLLIPNNLLGGNMIREIRQLAKTFGVVDVAATLGASRLILGAPKRNALINLLRGNVIREVSNSLPEEIDLLLYA